MEDNSTQYSDFTTRTAGGIVALSIISGLLNFGLAKLLDQFIFHPALCKSAGIVLCNASLQYAYHIAAIFVGIIGVVWLVRLFVYRPLLVVIALLVGTWPLFDTFFPILSWSWAIASLILMYMIGYLCFTWILRAYNLIIALVLTLLTTILLFVVSRI
jgi:hypothetical protein